MGSLTLPDAGRLYLDANCLIYSVEKIEPFWTILKPVWRAGSESRIEIVSSELTCLETLVRPIRERDDFLIRTYHELLLGSTDVRLIPMDLGVIQRAAHIRAEARLKTPDAIHAATALEADAAMYLTNDAAFNRVIGLRVQVRSETLAGSGEQRPPVAQPQAGADVPKPLAVRQVAGQAWGVLIDESDAWLSCESEEDARTIAAARVLKHQAESGRRAGAGFAAELERMADTLERYRMGFGARFFRREARQARGEASRE